MTESESFIPYAGISPAPDAPHDASHLRVLSILHYVWGGLVLVFSCFTIIYIVLGALMVTGNFTFPTSPGQPAMPPQMGWLFVGMGGCSLVLGGGLGVCSIVSGRRMAQRRSRVFSIVIASISCLSVPLGTTLGVFTIVILMRDSVRAMYAANAGD